MGIDWIALEAVLCSNRSNLLNDPDLTSLFYLQYLRQLCAESASVTVNWTWWVLLFTREKEGCLHQLQTKSFGSLGRPGLEVGTRTSILTCSNFANEYCRIAFPQKNIFNIFILELFLWQTRSFGLLERLFVRVGHEKVLC